METNTREAMTTEPEMTLELAQKTFECFKHFDKLAYDENVHNVQEEVLMKYREAKGFLSGHAAGVKESQAVVKELVGALKNLMTHTSHGDHVYFDELSKERCPFCNANKALESARRITQGNG